MLTKHINKNNLHHAYLIEGERAQIEEEIIAFIQDLGISTIGNPDFSHMSFDSFKINDARILKAFSAEKSLNAEKRIFIISLNNILLQAQNSMLKMFEEPIENTHFFLIMPDTSILLKTFLSRFYLISDKGGNREDVKEVEGFINMPLAGRINFIKELLKDDKKDATDMNNSPRVKAIKFINNLEQVLEKKLLNKDSANKNSSTAFFQHIFKVRKFLNQPGSSIKSLMESVAIITPNL